MSGTDPLKYVNGGTDAKQDVRLERLERMGDRREDDDRGWHVRPAVMLAVLGWLVTATLAGVGWAVGVSRELAVLQAQVEAAKADNSRQDLASTESLRLIRDELRDLRSEMRTVREALQADRRPRQ